MSATRLLVLGVVRFAQPVHGYDVRRELLSWRIEESANVKPGSIYSALRTLEKDGCIAVHARESDDNRPERTTYVLTPEGETEFYVLLRRGWWTVTPPQEPLIAPLCMMLSMPREELVAALAARASQLEAHLSSMTFLRASIADGATGADGGIPEHVREMIDFWQTRIRADLEWGRAFQQRLRDGAYTFHEEHSAIQA